MMNEWGIPGIELHSLLRDYLQRLATQGAYVPSIALAGGFTFEDQIFKGLALGAPYVKLIAMARGPLAAAMVAKTIGNADRAAEPADLHRALRHLGGRDLRHGDRAAGSASATASRSCRSGRIGFYTYYARLAQGLRQLMAGARKFAVRYVARDDIAALTREAAEVSGIPYVTDVDREAADKILSQ